MNKLSLCFDCSLLEVYIPKVNADYLSAEQLADLVWDAWRGSLLQMKIEKSAEPVLNTIELLFERMLIPRQPS
jgi:hypothetical protein